MRRWTLLLCAALLWAPLPAMAVTRANAAKKAAPAEEQEMTLAELLGRDLAGAVDGAGEAYDAMKAALDKQSRRKRGGTNAALREMADVRALYAKALQRARDAKLKDDNALLRDQVVVSITQSLRACDLITQGLRDGDKGPSDTGVDLAAMAQGDLDSIASGQSPAGVSGDATGPNKIGPSIGSNIGLSGQGGSFNISMDLNLSVPVSNATDVGVGMQMTGASSDASGNVSLGGNVFSRYHFLGAFPKSPGLVPYVGAKLGMTWGTNWSGTGLNFNTSDSLGLDLSGQVGMLIFVSKQSAFTLQAELGRNSSSSSDASGNVTETSGNSSSLTLGMRRMF